MCQLSLQLDSRNKNKVGSVGDNIMVVSFSSKWMRLEEANVYIYPCWYLCYKARNHWEITTNIREHRAFAKVPILIFSQLCLDWLKWVIHGTFPIFCDGLLVLVTTSVHFFWGMKLNAHNDDHCTFLGTHLLQLLGIVFPRFVKFANLSSTQVLFLTFANFSNTQVLLINFVVGGTRGRFLCVGLMPEVRCSCFLVWWWWGIEMTLDLGFCVLFECLILLLQIFIHIFCGNSYQFKEWPPYCIKIS